jgi:hypothetical protein
MSLFGALGRAYVINRLAQRGRHRRYGRSPYGRHSGFFGPPRRRGRTGFWGPMPYYSGRTRRGSRVHVSGCCLPIPLGMLLATAVGARGLMRRR